MRDQVCPFKVGDKVVEFTSDHEPYRVWTVTRVMKRYFETETPRAGVSIKWGFDGFRYGRESSYSRMRVYAFTDEHRERMEQLSQLQMLRNAADELVKQLREAKRDPEGLKLVAHLASMPEFMKLADDAIARARDLDASLKARYPNG